MACPDASAAIHECVLAIKARVPVDVLAETIHAFPSTSRIFNGLFADARRELDARAASSPRRRLALEDDLAVHQDQRGRAVASAPPGSTGSSSAAAPGRPRCRRAGPAIEPAAVRSRAATAPVEAGGPERPVERERLVRPERRRAGRPARILAADGQRDARATDRSARPARRSRTRGRRRSARATPTCSRSARRGRPTAGAPAAASDPTWTGWTLAAIAGRARTGRDRPGASELDVLEPRHQRDAAPAVGVEHVERGPDRGVADRVDLRRDPGRGGPRRRASAQLVGRRDPDAAPARPAGSG